jgi:LytS/YehU family sensor histidine kinase
MMWVETKTVIELQSDIVAIEAYLQLERAVFVLKISFRFRLLQLN